jgi:hypothetical protein
LSLLIAVMMLMHYLWVVVVVYKMFIDSFMSLSPCRCLPLRKVQYYNLDFRPAVEECFWENNSDFRPWLVPHASGRWV